MNKLTILGICILFLIGLNVVSAEWWNPFSWFDGEETTLEEQVEKYMENNISMYRLKYENLILETPVNTRCDWDSSKEFRRCYHSFTLTNNLNDFRLNWNKIEKLVKLQYPERTDLNELVLHIPTENKVKKKAKDLKNYLNNNIITLKKGKSYDFSIEFDYPPNTNDEWDLTFIHPDNTSITIDPTISACSNIVAPGVYLLDTDITDSSLTKCMNITVSNVTLDCQGNTIDSDGGTADYGIYIVGVTGADVNITVQNCVVSDWDSQMIYVTQTDGVTFNNINLTNIPDYGVYTFEADNIIFNNTIIDITGGDAGFWCHDSEDGFIENMEIFGGSILAFTSTNCLGVTTNYTIKNSKFYDSTEYDFKHTVDSDNECNFILEGVNGTDNKTIFFSNKNGTKISGWNNVSSIFLCNADNSIIENVTINNTNIRNNGITIYRSHNLTIQNSFMYGTEKQILVYDSNDLIVQHNYLESSDTYAIDIEENTDHSDDFVIYNNTIVSADTRGIYANSYGGNITYNHIHNHSSYAIYGRGLGGSDLVIFNNLLNATDGNNNYISAGTSTTTFWNTSKQLGTRIFSNGTHIGGNYYTNASKTGYSDTCADSNTDGFCDVSYTSPDPDAVDYLPLSDEYQLDYDSQFTNIQTNTPRGYGYNISINVTVTDLDNLINVFVEITFPNSTNVNFTMTNVSSLYSYSLDDTWQNGRHNFTIIANDTLGNINRSSASSFNITAKAVISIKTINSIYNLTQQINLTDPPMEIFDSYDRFDEFVLEETTSYIIEFKRLPILEYNDVVVSESEKSIKVKFLNIFYDEKTISETISNDIKKRTLKHKNDLLEEHDDLLKKLSKKAKHEYKYVMNGIALNLTDNELDEISKLPYIEKIWEDGFHNLTIDSSVPHINADDVWTQQNSSGDNITGKGIIIAIVDSGIDYTHTFFGNCSTINFTSGNCKKIPYGYDFVNNDNDPFDDYGHGTHVSGIAAGYDPDGVYMGVAPNATLIEYKACSSAGSCPDSALISSIENATLYGADIISMSFGGDYYVDEEPLGTALTNAWNNGTVLVASAGNAGDDYPDAENTMRCPSCLPFVISVGSYYSVTNVLSGFSSRGYGWNSSNIPVTLKPDVVAPGRYITSPVPTGSCTLCSASGLRKLSGTSMSAPHASGVIALLKQAHPTWNKEELRAALTNPAIDIGYTILEQGSGRIDAFNSYNITAITLPHNYLFNNNTNISIQIYNGSAIFNITSKVNYPVTYSLSFSGTNFSGTLNTTEITLPAYNTISFMLNITVNNSQSNYTSYNGKITINSSTQTFYIPISVYTILNPTSCPAFKYDIISNYTFSSLATCRYPDVVGDSYFFTVNGDNITIDCNGSTIDGIYQKRGGTGFYVNNSDKFVFKNCTIKKYETGINIYNSPNSTIKDSRFEQDSSFILIGSQSEYATITNNIFFDTDESGIQVIGNHTTISNNLFNKSSHYMLRILGNVKLEVGHIDVINNKFVNLKFGSEIWGAVDVNYSYNNFTNSYLNGYVFSGKDHYFGYNRMIYDSEAPCDACDDWGISGIVIDRRGTIYPPTKNIITEGNYINVTKWGIYSYDADNITHRDMILEADSETIYLYNTDAYLVNVTWSSPGKDISGGSELHRRWWVEVNITNSSGGNPIPGVTITTYINKSGTWESVTSGITDSDGYLKIPATQYIENDTSLTYYETKIEADKTGYYSNNTIFDNLTTNSLVNLTLLYGEPVIPIITIVAPSNNSISTTTWIMLNITTDIACENATYSLNGTANITMNKTDNTHFYKNITSLSDNSKFNITFYANSTSGGWGASSIYYFTVNTSYTEVSVTKSMINNTGSVDFRGYLTLKVQRDNSGTWEDYKIVTNNQLINLSTTAPYALDIRWFADGAYTANATGIFRALVELKDNNNNILTFDNGSYINSTYEFNVTDGGLPSVTIVSPSDNSYIKINYSILNYTVTDDYDISLNCYYILDGNETASPNNPITNNTYDDINMSNLNESTHTVYVKCNDGTQNGSSSTKTFTTDFTLPTIINPTPVNGSQIIGSSTEEFTMYPSDTFLDVDTCRLYWKYPESETYTKEDMNYISGNCTVNVDLSEIVDVEEVYYYFEVNDTATNIGVLGTSLTPMAATTSSDITKPSFSNNKTNASSTTYKGTDVQINLTITDNVAIDFYRLSTNDSVGFSWVNESLIDASDSASVNASFNNTISNFPLGGGTFGWRVWANDTNGNAGQSNIYTFLVIDHSPPTYFNSHSRFQNNASTLTKVNGVVNWSIELSDVGGGLSFYFFAHNNSGTLLNVSNGSISGTSAFVNKTITITLAQGNYICGQYWFNDTSNNINQTLLTESGACFTVADTLPTVPTSDSLTPNDPIITDELTGVCSGSTDADGDTITYHCQFYDITESSIRQSFSSDCTYQLSSPSDLADQFRVDCRATTPLGNSLTDRTGTDLETVRTTSIYEINSFSDGTSEGSMTFYSSVYKNITLPYWAVVTKAEIDLTGTYSVFNYTGFWFNTSSQGERFPSGMVWNGSSFFIVGYDDDIVLEYNSTGNYTGFNFSTSPLTSPDGIAWNGSSFFIVEGETDVIAEFNSSGGYTGNNFSITESGSAADIAWNGSSFFIIDNTNENIYEYDSTGSYTGFNFDVSIQGNAGQGLTYSSKNNKLYYSEVSSQKIYEYTPQGTYTNISFSIRDSTNGVFGIAYKEPNIYAILWASDTVLEYSPTYPENITIRTYGEITYQNLSVFNGTATNIDLNITSLQKCVDSVSSGNVNCTINFTSATAGILEYSNIEVDYLIPLNITFKDEKSNTIIEGETLSIFLETTGFSQLYSSTNPFKVNLSIAGTYDLKASSTNYPSREYVIEVLEARNDLVLYLINSTDSTEKTFYVRGSSINAIEGVYINFTRLIGGVRKTVAEEYTDYDGAASLYLDEDYEYKIIFSKDGYDTLTIDLEPTNDEYIITLTLSTGKYNVSVYEGIRYSFVPSNTILNNHTKYNFTFTLNSSVWSVTGCNLYLWNGTILLDSTSDYTANSCYLRIEQDTASMTNITSEATYQIGSTYNFTVSQQYSVIYSYEGEFSLKNFLDDLTNFGMGGFDSFGRMMLAFIVIFVILALAGQQVGFDNKEVLIIMFIALVGFFSFINWFYLDFVLNILGLRKWFIFYLVSIVGFALIWNKWRK